MNIKWDRFIITRRNAIGSCYYIKENFPFGKKVKDVGFTIIPLKLYINDKGRAKLLIGFGRGKKLFDKRESIKNVNLIEI